MNIFTIAGLLHAGADPASKVREEISVIFCSQVSLWVHCCKRDEISSLYFTTLP